MRSIAARITALLFLASLLVLPTQVKNVTGSITPTATVTFPVSSQHPIGRPFGASLHFPGELENDTAPETTSFAACEFGWTRTCNFLWQSMEPEEGNFSAVDDPTMYHNRFLANMNAINTRVLPLIDGPPGWLNESAPWYISQEHRPLLRRYVNRTVTAFQDVMPAWELFNEANNVWGNAMGTWEEYFSILIDAAETIKRVNDSLDVLVGGLGGYKELEFLDCLVENLTMTPTSVPGFDVARDLFSGIAFHPYSSPPEHLAVKLMEYDNILAKHNWTSKDGARHWITEIGSETDSPKDGAGGFMIDPQREFAAMLAKQMTIAVSWQVDGFNIWEYRDWDPPGVFTRDFPHAGIVYHDASWKAATYACNWTNHYIGNGHMSLMPVVFPAPVAGIVTKNDHPVNGHDQWAIVAWNPQHQGRVALRIEFNATIHSASLHDYASAAVTALPCTGESWVDLQAGYEPALLVVECEPSSSCSPVVLFDATGGCFAGLLVSAIALVAMNAWVQVKKRHEPGGEARGA